MCISSKFPDNASAAEERALTLGLDFPCFSLMDLFGENHLIHVGLHFLSCKVAVNATYLEL